LDKPAARLLFASRLKAARLAAGLTQEALGIRAGIDQDVARTRINRYERAVHDCDSATAERLAQVVEEPLAALYADSDLMAQAITAFARLGEADQRAAVTALNDMVSRSNKSAKAKP
jgi:transcriptional regulator with XRE-family HTH domain